MPVPHRIVDAILDDLGDAAAMVGETIAKGLDKPPEAVGGPEAVHRIVDRVFDGLNAARKGFGEGLAKGLDHPVEQFGIPPDAPEAPKIPSLRR